MQPRLAWVRPAAFLIAASVQVGLAQVQPTATLQVTLRNSVEYQHDIPDPARFATNPGPTPSGGFRNFGSVTLLGDIVSVNGTPAKGLYAGRTEAILASPMPNPGGAIADVTRVDGNIFVSDGAGGHLRNIARDGVVTTVAGSGAAHRFNNGQGANNDFDTTVGELLYAGSSPGSVAGVFQVTLRLPADCRAIGDTVHFCLVVESERRQATVAVRQEVP